MTIVLYSALHIKCQQCYSLAPLRGLIINSTPRTMFIILACFSIAMSQSFLIWIKMMVLESGTLGKFLEFDHVLLVESWWIKLVPLEESRGELVSSVLLSSTWGHTENLPSGIWRRPLARTPPFRHTDLRLPPSRNERNTFLYFTRHLAYGILL